jgi:branched-subunit amino acid ABC-type transport system permease component
MKGTYRQLCQTILDVERLPGGRSMMLGAIAFFVYALNFSWVLKRYRPSALTATLALMPIWFAVSFGLWFLVERQW